MRIKSFIVCILFAATLFMIGCDQVSLKMEDHSISKEEKKEEKKKKEKKQKESVANESIPASELLDAFLKGEIDAQGKYEGKDSFSISDIEKNDEEWLRFSEHSRFDVDNDSEEELIMEGPYGGMVLDARDNKVYLLAKGEGTTGVLTFAKYDNAVWVVHADTSHGERKTYILDKYNGKGEIIESVTFNENEILDVNLFNWDSVDDSNTDKDKKVRPEESEEDQDLNAEYDFEGDETLEDTGETTLKKNPDSRTEFLDLYKVADIIPPNCLLGVPRMIQNYLDKAFGEKLPCYTIQLNDQSLEKNEIYGAFDFTVDEYPGYSFRYAHYYGLDKVYISSPQLDRVKFDD